MKSKLSLILFLGLSIHAFAQENLTYQKPSKSILDLVDYESTICKHGYEGIHDSNL
jgi:hypothetical protein